MAENAIEIQEKPILFSGPMIRAIIENRKTQTRSVTKQQPPPCKGFPHQAPDGEWGIYLDRPNVGPYKHLGACPYGKPGDRLWVRETWCIGGNSTRVCYRASEGSDADYWKPSIHMPRAYSRLTLEIVSVKVERVQEISEEDAIAEGCVPEVVTAEDVADLQIMDVSPAIKELGRILGPGQFTAKHEFSKLWDSINSKRGFGWKANPWVWAIEFRVVAAGERRA